ncbi:glutamine amidotransferase [Aspergillus sclerotialis]|uniref:Glutamine amidotransferase n=1 Tax=Aspergillus sclerotialis TaxID=2070753 RepID=A0A3A2Z4V3_9EURO|nr:glutamine amidotransferase [Aspergillus sclerotialis]
MTTMRIAIIEGDSPINPVRERLGTYGDMFERLLNAGLGVLKWENKVDLKVMKTSVVDNPVFPSPEMYDAVLLTGGKWDAFADLEWIIQLTKYVEKIFKETTKPILGVCFGHQIIARALGSHRTRW